MRIAGIYSFNNGEQVVRLKYQNLLDEVFECIQLIDAENCRSKESLEKTMRGQMLFSPIELNQKFKDNLYPKGWRVAKVMCDYSTAFYVTGYERKPLRKGAFRAMDFVKDKLGIEVQFGKYSFMVYNVAAKMTIFRNLGYIDTGVEIVPVKALADEMSSGVSYFEQFVWDLQHRGIADIDVPVMVIGIDV